MESWSFLCLQCTAQNGTLRCGGCGLARFCSHTCQRLSWKAGGHGRTRCDALKASAANVAEEGSLEKLVRSLLPAAQDEDVIATMAHLERVLRGQVRERIARKAASKPPRKRGALTSPT
jgi:hypothetical protein